VNIRHKVVAGEASGNPAALQAPQGTIRIGGQQCAFDDGKARTVFVDVLTEAGAANGIVCLGLGHLMSPMEGRPHVEGDIHLRMSLQMAASLVEALSGAMNRAVAQVDVHKSN